MIDNDPLQPSLRDDPPGTTETRRRRRSRDGLFQRNGFWWIDYRDVDGRRHRRKAAPDYATARLVYRETMTAIAKGDALGVREEGLRLRDFVERTYWPAVSATMSPLWAQLSHGILRRAILPRFGTLRLSAVRRDDVERWYAERLEGVSASTANKELGRLKHLLARAVAWRYLKHDSTKGIKKARENPGRVRYLTTEERALLAQEANPTLRLYILGALQTGARRSELIQVRRGDADFKHRLITFPTTKNGDRRVIPMTEALAAAVSALPRNLNPEARVFPPITPHALTRAFARLVKRVGLPNVTFHDLRHDAASTLTMAGVPQRTIMEILGHRDGRMTLRYQHLAPGHLREAMRALEGPAVTPDRASLGHAH